MRLRSHQRSMLALMEEIQQGRRLRDVYAAVTPGAGKSWLPVIAARALIPAFADRICWVVPRKNLARQAEDVFARNSGLQQVLPHEHLIRAAGNEADPSRGLSGYVVTYQAVGMDTAGQHAREFARRRYILVLDEPHHIADDAQWPERLAPLVDRAVLRIFMSGTFERHDRERIAFIPYRKTESGEYPDLEGGNPETSATIQYTRSQALEEGSIANLIFRRHDAHGIAWETAEGEQKMFDSFDGIAGQDARSALWTALTRRYAFDLLDRGLASWREYRQAAPWAKLLIVAHNQARAEELHSYVSAQGVRSDVAISNDTPAAVRAIDRFKGLRKPPLDALVTVQMAYEGMDVPQISHVVCLTGIRSKPWLEQCFARAARVFPGKTHGYIWVPDDPMFRRVYEQVLIDQAAAAHAVAAEVPEFRRRGPDGSSAPGNVGHTGLVALDASVGAETNSDMTGLSMTTRETALFASIALEAGIRGLAPMEVRRLVMDGQVPLGVSVTPDQVLRLREQYARTPPPVVSIQPGLVLRPSEREQEYRDKIAGWIKRHAHTRFPGETPSARECRVAHIRDVNTALLKAFGRRDRLRLDKLKLLWKHVQRWYPV